MHETLSGTSFWWQLTIIDDDFPIKKLLSIITTHAISHAIKRLRRKSRHDTGDFEDFLTLPLLYLLSISSWKLEELVICFELISRSMNDCDAKCFGKMPKISKKRNSSQWIGNTYWNFTSECKHLQGDNLEEETREQGFEFLRSEANVICLDFQSFYSGWRHISSTFCNLLCFHARRNKKCVICDLERRGLILSIIILRGSSAWALTVITLICLDRTGTFNQELIVFRKSTYK